MLTNLQNFNIPDNYRQKWYNMTRKGGSVDLSINLSETI